jgi:ring-1,2-phenylacetyl-CoA epoxidase subunit PaaD
MTPTDVFRILEEVKDPEVPVLSVVDLGVIRDIREMDDQEGWVVTITPTYMGCPAMDMIAAEIRMTLIAHGAGSVRVERSLSPAWTTDWMTEGGRAKLKAYGIAPPQMKGRLPEPVTCPQCGSKHTRLVSAFGSTACKALFQCSDCSEPFDSFKCI